MNGDLRDIILIALQMLSQNFEQMKEIYAPACFSVV